MTPAAHLTSLSLGSFKKEGNIYLGVIMGSDEVILKFLVCHRDCVYLVSVFSPRPAKSYCLVC